MILAWGCGAGARRDACFSGSPSLRRIHNGEGVLLLLGRSSAGKTCAQCFGFAEDDAEGCNLFRASFNSCRTCHV